MYLLYEIVVCFLGIGGLYFVFYKRCLSSDLFINYLLFILFMSCCIFLIVCSGLVVSTDKEVGLNKTGKDAK